MTELQRLTIYVVFLASFLAVNAALICAISCLAAIQEVDLVIVTFMLIPVMWAGVALGYLAFGGNLPRLRDEVFEKIIGKKGKK